MITQEAVLEFIPCILLYTCPHTPMYLSSVDDSVDDSVDNLLRVSCVKREENMQKWRDVSPPF